MKNLDDIIKANEKLVYKYVHKYNGIHDPEMISYGFEGLYRAAATYDESKGYAFSTYASTCIFNSIGNYLRSIRNKPIEVSYEEHMSGATVIDEEDTDCYLLQLIVKIAEEFPKTDLPILKLWINSEFEMKQVEIARRLKCSQPKVSKVISDFKRRLKEEKNARHSRITLQD